MTRNKPRLTRRALLKRAALTAAGAAAAPHVITSAALGAGATPPASERIGMGSIGVGGRGNGLLNGFLGLPDCRCLAVADPFKSRRQRTAERINKRYNSTDCAAYADFRDLLARDDIDGVVVATPDHWHVPAALAAVRAGKHVYVEKPLGLAVQWDIELRETVRRYGSTFQYGTQQRSSAHLRHACELVHSGRIGEVKEIEVHAPGGRAGGSTTPIPVPDGFDYDMWLGPAPYSPYTKDRCTSAGSWFVYDNSIGFLGGWGAHPLDIAVWGWDKGNQVPVEIEGTGTIPTEGLFDVVKDWDVRGRYSGGIAFRFIGPGKDLTKYVGTEGTIWVGRGYLRTEPETLKDSAIGPNDVHLVKSVNHGQSFLDGIKTRSDAVSNIDDAVQSDIISHLTDIAIRTGRKIRWDPKAETIVGDDEAARMLARDLRSPWRL